MNFTKEIVATLCAGLDKEPLFHMSLGSKELFHSNFLSSVLSTVSIPYPVSEAASSILS
jgi:hypothetical protein